MSRSRIQIVPHLDSSQLNQRYQDCQEPKKKNYWQIIRLLSRADMPMTTEQVAETMGVSTDWIRKLARRYNRLGPIAIADNHQHKYNRKSLSLGYGDRTKVS
ncbi:helix-turn-helix domain-containing protein [Tumidithrix helvetica PCC 7403]|uniref:helix-turn-helix domain-containing protein n=1 Tax=Tumidithrix helvetica TaxID=3457545 RepID=UPI003C896A19